MRDPREQIIRLQNDRIAGMQRQIEENLAAVRANPTRDHAARRGQ